MDKKPSFKKGDKVYAIIENQKDEFFVFKGKLIKWDSMVKEYKKGETYFRPNIFPKNKSVYDFIDCYKWYRKTPVFLVDRSRMVHADDDNAEEIVKKRLERILIRYANYFSKQRKRFDEREKEAYKKLTILRQPKWKKLFGVRTV